MSSEKHSSCILAHKPYQINWFYVSAVKGELIAINQSDSLEFNHSHIHNLMAKVIPCK